MKKAQKNYFVLQSNDLNEYKKPKKKMNIFLKIIMVLFGK